MALFRNVFVSEWRCVGMALCRNGNMSGNIVVNYEMSGDKQSDNLLEWSIPFSFLFLVFFGNMNYKIHGCLKLFATYFTLLFCMF